MFSQHGEDAGDRGFLGRIETHVVDVQRDDHNVVQLIEQAWFEELFIFDVVFKESAGIDCLRVFCYVSLFL